VDLLARMARGSLGSGGIEGCGSLSGAPATLFFWEEVIAMGTVNVTERFWSVQGTGHLAGMPEWFIRLSGCSVPCPIRAACDEPESLAIGAGYTIDAEALADEALAEVGQGGWVSITGGEPCDQPEGLLSLGIELERRDVRIHLQTSGTLPVPIRTDWLTVSPKVYATDLSWTWGQEMVVIFDANRYSQSDLQDYSDHTRFYDYYLCPLWVDGECNARETFAMVKKLNKDGHRWRMTSQMHKYVGVE
jgi:7-carboxy-7-deazaguanine synthase